MTVITVAKVGNQIAIASDSLISCEGLTYPSDDGPKFFRPEAEEGREGKVLVGISSTVRVDQIIRTVQYTERSSYTDAVKKALAEKDIRPEYHDDNVPAYGAWMLVVDGPDVFEIANDFAELKVADYAAIGCGFQVALGAMHHATRLPLTAAKVAVAGVEAAIRHTTGCGGEIHYELIDL